MSRADLETVPTREVTLQAREVLANVIEVQDATEGTDDGEHIIAHAIAAAREQGAAEMRERCARVCDMRAEIIKHTSHMDGLGLGDARSERVCAGCATDIRALPTTPDPGESE